MRTTAAAGRVACKLGRRLLRRVVRVRKRCEDDMLVGYVDVVVGKRGMLVVQRGGV